MRPSTVCCLFLFALLVGYDPVQGAGMTRGLPTDEKLTIVRESSELLFGGCPKISATTMNVRLQALKTKSGTIFQRKTVTDDVVTCLVSRGSQNLTDRSIKECSEQTEAAGLQTFRWDGGQCTGYSQGIPSNVGHCTRDGAVVLYSVETSALSSPVVSNITWNVTGNLINTTWNVAPDSCFAVYRVSTLFAETIVSDKFAYVGGEAVDPCSEWNLTVTAEYVNSDVVGSEETVTVVVPKVLELSLNLTHGPAVVSASWGSEYTCNPLKEPAYGGPIKSYKVELGDQMETTDESTFEYTFGPKSQSCTDTAHGLGPYWNTVTLKAFDDTDAQIGEAVTAILTDTILPGKRYKTRYGNCIYNQKLDQLPDGVGLTYDQVVAFCRQTFFSDIMGRPLGKYVEELQDLKSSSIVLGPHFLGLKKESNEDWKWLDGTVQSLTDGSWDTAQPYGSGNCAEMTASHRLAAVSCNATDKNIVCFDVTTV